MMSLNSPVVLFVQLETSIPWSLYDEMWLDSPDEADPLLVPSSDDPVDIKLVLFIVLFPVGLTPFKALVFAYIPLNVLFGRIFSYK